MFELDETLSIGASIPVAGAFDLECALHTAWLLLHDLRIDQVLEVSIMFNRVVDDFFIALTNPSSYCRRTVLLLRAKVALASSLD